MPANRFEVLECRAAIAALGARELDGDRPRAGGLDVLAQHILGMACAAPFTADALYAEVTSARALSRAAAQGFRRCAALSSSMAATRSREYERWRRLFHDSQGRYHVVSPQVARRYRMNIGTIVEAVMLRVRVGGRVLGEVEEYFAQGLVARRHLRLRRRAPALRGHPRHGSARPARAQRAAAENPGL